MARRTRQEGSGPAAGSTMALQPGCLYLVATPIGNLEDITFRAVRVLGQVDLVAAEDTRSARVLFAHHGISTPTVSLYAHNEEQRAGDLVARLEAGGTVALISEAGSPALSDPGWRTVQRCLAAGLAIDVIPGPSAITTALLLSGLPSDRFRWLGFLPRRGRRRKSMIDEIRRSRETVILFEAPGRTGQTLAELAAALGTRLAAVTRELTKLHQEALRGPLPELALRFADTPPRGEVTLVIAGAEAAEGLDEEALATAVRARLAQGASARDISEQLGERAGKRRVYQLALELSAERRRC